MLYFKYIKLISLIVIDCGSPEKPRNGIIIGNDFKFGATVEYECTNGYMLVGVKSRYCQEDGTWSSDSPFCKSKSSCDLVPCSCDLFYSASHVTHTLIGVQTFLFLCQVCYNTDTNSSFVHPWEVFFKSIKQFLSSYEKYLSTYINIYIYIYICTFVSFIIIIHVEY